MAEDRPVSILIIVRFELEGSTIYLYLYYITVVLLSICIHTRKHHIAYFWIICDPDYGM